MKRTKALLVCLFAVLCVGFLPLQGEVQAAVQLQVKDVGMDIHPSTILKQPLTNRPIELTGPEQEAIFYYEMRSAPADTEHRLVLHYSHSELLIAPSSVTIHVDEEAVLSKPLNGEELAGKIVVPLSGKALEKGFHQVSIAFSGIIKEGVCVEQGTPGNWFTIGIDSYLQLSGQRSDEELSLADYLHDFTGTANRPAFIVLPEEGSLETVNNGIQLAAYLAEQGDEEEAHQVIRESELQQITGNLIVIGTHSEFTSPLLKDLLQQAALPSEKDSVTISRHTLTDRKQQADMLFAIASSPEDFDKRLDVLTDPTLTKQLSGKQMTIKTLPERKADSDERIIPLKKFGITSFTLDRNNRESQQFFHYVPFASEKDQSPILELHLKHTALAARDIEQAADMTERDMELVVLVNDVPHSVNIRKLVEKKEGSYTVRIPVEPNAIQDKRMISLQFVGNGLLTKNPCIATDQNRWIYIDEDSHFTFPVEKETSSFSLAAFPSPFIDKGEDTLIILPSSESEWDQSLLDLYRALFVYSQPMPWSLATAEKVTAEQIKDRHLIFVGGPDIQPLLKGKADKLIMPYDGGTPDLQSFGFVQEAMENVGWIQPSPWGNGKYSMLVFDRVDESNSYLDKVLLDYVRDSDEQATIASQSNNRQVFTNAALLQEVPATAVESQTLTKNLSIWEIAGFGALVLFSFAAAIFMVKKRKR
ncbi:cellulose biosynthesis cyclic di-GMP-binding regulatory protein BcsB [Sporosarcina sp. FSL W7-1349]|uniref:cellulose biosynthesis cyclic di-GMP-binding regulatory protein BcsB n=1 Tax=Sporosarcina sp. FSL W7-1349 TaxID=2921561 RepID=UPI0030F7BAC0